MIPSWTQWKKWSLPSKHTAISLLVGILSLFVGIAAWVFSGDNGETQNNIKNDLKQLIADVNDANRKEDEYVKRYLKERIGEIEKVEILESNSISVARIYYFSYWYKLTSNFRAAVEIRRVENLNEKYSDDQGWGNAHLLNQSGSEPNTIHLGETEYIDIDRLEKGSVYDVRFVDYNYDSDEPPALPFRFQMK